MKERNELTNLIKYHWPLCLTLTPQKSAAILQMYTICFIEIIK